MNQFEKIISQMPTLNMNHNCKVLDSLNPTGLEVIGLDENSEYYKLCADYAYVSMSFIQMGVMNMTYYIILNKALKILERSNKGVQNGGMNIAKMLQSVIYSFLLISGSYVSNVDSNIEPYALNERIHENALFMGTMAIESKTIADNLSKEEAELVVATIEEINDSLRMVGSEAKYNCIKTGTSIREQELHKDNAQWVSDYKRSKMTTKELAEEYAFDIGSTLSGTATAFMRGLRSEKNPSLQREVVLLEDEEFNPFSYLNVYITRCKASPIPNFALETNVNNGKYSINVKSYFGNENTVELLKLHMQTIKKIEQKMTLKNEDYDLLLELKERILMQIDLITSYTLFIPLDIPDLRSNMDSIIFARNVFESTAALIKEVLPITRASGMLSQKISRIIQEKKEHESVAFWESLSTLPKTFLKVAIQDTANITMEVFDAAENIITHGSINLANITRYGIYEILYAFIPLFGVIGAFAICNILYKREIRLTEGRRGGAKTKKTKKTKK